MLFMFVQIVHDFIKKCLHKKLESVENYKKTLNHNKITKQKNIPAS